MPLHVERYSLDQADEYRRFVRGCRRALVQQSWEWGRVIAGIGQDEPIFFLARGGDGRPVGALPAYLYQAPPASLLISVPQAGGYGGVVVADDTQEVEEVYAALLELFVDEARHRGCALATISTTPFFGRPELYRRFFEPDYQRENFFQYLNLETDFLAQASSKQRGNIRRSLQKAQRHGLTVTFEGNDQLFDKWYSVHAARMNELGTLPLPRRLFEGARQYLIPEGLGFFAYVLDAGRVIGGGLFIGHKDVIDAYLMSSDSASVDKQPNSLLVSAACERARSLGFRFFNWQSCSSRESGVYHYKQSWGSVEGTHYYLTKITGDISGLKALGLDEIKKRYRWHYVMPYECFADGVLLEK